MYEETFEELGLSQNEARIYEALLELGEASITDISKQVNIHRRSTYDAIRRLVEKGLAIPVLGEEQKRFTPVEPDKLLEIIEEKKTKLEKALPALRKLFEGKQATEGTYIYKGVEGYKNLLRDITQVGEDVYTIGARGMWADPRLKLYIEKVWKEAKAKKIAFHLLLDASAVNETADLLKHDAIEYKIVPKQYTSAMSIDIYGDRVATIVGEKPGELEEHFTISMTLNQKLADSYRQLWQLIWDSIKETPKTKKRG